MRGTKAKALRVIARSRTEGLPNKDYYIMNRSRRRVVVDSPTGHKSYIEPPGTFALKDGCTRAVYQQLKLASKEIL